MRSLSIEFRTLETASEHKAHRSCFLSWQDHVVRNPCWYSNVVVTTVMAASHLPAYQQMFAAHEISTPWVAGDSMAAAAKILAQSWAKDGYLIILTLLFDHDEEAMETWLPPMLDCIIEPSLAPH